MFGLEEIFSILLNEWKLVGILVLGLVIYYLGKKDGRQTKFLETVPGPPSLPLIGNAWQLAVPNEELAEVLHSFYKKYGPVYVAWLGNQPVVLLCESSALETILSSSVHTEKSKDYDFLSKWLGSGLLTAKPKKWHGRRKLLTPTFHFKILEEFSIVFNEQANVFVNILEKKANGEAFDIFPYVTRCALDIICETAMGRKLNTQSQQGGEELEYVNAVYGYGDILLQKFVRPWLRLGLIWRLSGNASKEAKYVKTLHDFTNTVIFKKKLERERINTAKSEEDEFSQKKRKAFLDLLLDLAEQDSTSLTDTDIREEVDTFMFEGHDTTAASMVWTILNLSCHPEHQKLVQDELDEIFGNDRERNITSADISKMKYLDCCIKESLRIYPSVPFYFRQITEDVKIGEHTIPKGIAVCIPDYILHRNENVFPDPEVFKPQRFFQEDVIERNAFAYIPFSAGPRNCIGQKFAMLEEKIILAKLFLNFTFHSVKERKDVKMVPDIILRPSRGIYVTMLPRKLH